MLSRRIIILGAGISGLAAAWYLKQRLGTQAQVIVLEQSERAGGWIESAQQGEFLLEQGPRSCRTHGSGRDTLALVEALGLQDQVIVPHSDARYRYIYYDRKLEPIPTHFWQIPFSPLTQRWLQALIRDWKMPKRMEEDESIAVFFARRIGQEWVDRLIDPFVSGIYAGDCNRLSLKSCFPLFDTWEQHHGSLVRGAWSHRSVKEPNSLFIRRMLQFSLFSFQRGMETLPRTLALRLKESVRFGQKVENLTFHENKIDVRLESGEMMEADHVISTLPLPVLGNVLANYPLLAGQCSKIDYASVDVVSLGYDHQVSARKGFGYLVPFQAQSNILGCVWDSSVFPAQNNGKHHTRWTVMLGGTRHPQVEQMTEEEVAKEALAGLAEQCGEGTAPAMLRVKKAKGAIPQFEVGYQTWREAFIGSMYALSPRLTLSGSAFSGVSINDCIAQAKRLALELAV